MNEKVIDLMAEFILSTQEGNCLTCDNPMRNVNIRREEIQGCDGNCQHYKEYTKDDIIKMFKKEAERV